MNMEKLGRTLYSNLANLITGLRIIFTVPFVMYSGELLQKQGGSWLNYICCLAVIWLSDIIDGKLARRLRITGSFGAALDVAADVLFVFSAHIQLAYYQLLPVWFVVLIIEKIVNYLITSSLISRKTGGRFSFIRDPIGRIVSAAYFITPFMLQAGCRLGTGWYLSARAIICIIACFGLISSIYRYIYVLKTDCNFIQSKH